MTRNFVVGDVVMTPLVPQVLVAVVLTIIGSFVLERLGFFKLVVHRPLVEVCLFCILLGMMVTFAR